MNKESKLRNLEAINAKMHEFVDFISKPSENISGSLMLGDLMLENLKTLGQAALGIIEELENENNLELKSQLNVEKQKGLKGEKTTAHLLSQSNM